jgi:hypothetical protein
MALSANPFGGGAVVFDSSPYMRYYLNTKAQKDAKDEAIAKHLTDLPNTLNDAGMRLQDVGGLIDRKNKIKDFYFQNRDNILNQDKDRGQAYQQYMSLINDASSHINRSKTEGKTDMLLAQHALAHPEQRDLWTDNTVKAFNARQHSIDDQEFYKDAGRTQTYGVDDFALNPKPFDTKAQMEALKTIQYGMKKESTPDINGQQIDRDKQQKITPYTADFPTESKRVMAERGGALYDEDPTVKSHFDNHPLSQQEHDQLNTAYQSIYGKDKHVENGRDAAKAWAILNTPAPEKTVKIEKWEDPNAWKTKSDYEWNRKQAAKAAGAKRADDILNKHVSDLIANASEGSENYGGASEDRSKFIKLTPVEQKAFAITVDGKQVAPDDVVHTGHGNFYALFYKRDPKTEEIERDDRGKAIIDRGISYRSTYRQTKTNIGRIILSKKEEVDELGNSDEFDDTPITPTMGTTQGVYTAPKKALHSKYAGGF